MKSFNSDFWVLTGTTAPVIALACIVLFGDLVALARDTYRVYQDMKTRASYNLVAISHFSYTLNGANIAFQGVILYAAMSSISDGKNFFSMSYVAYYESLSLAALLLCSGLTVAAKIKYRRIEHQHKPKINTARYMWNLSRNKKTSSRR